MNLKNLERALTQILSERHNANIKIKLTDKKEVKAA